MKFLNKNGTNSLVINKSKNAFDVVFSHAKMTVLLDDGPELTCPLEWFHRLKNATSNQLNNRRLIGNGEGIHWNEIDEDILIKNLLE